MRREIVLALAVMVVILGYVAWGMSNVIRTWQAPPATPAPLAIRTAAPPPTSRPTGAAPATTAVAAVVATSVAAPTVAAVAPTVAVVEPTAAAAEPTAVVEPTAAVVEPTAAASTSPAASPAATSIVSASPTLQPALALAATVLAPATGPGAGQTAAATPTPSAGTQSLPTVAPPATPLTPAPAPAAGSRRWISGLSYANISDRLNGAFKTTCSGPTSSDLLAWKCVAFSADGTVRLTAVINGLDAERIVSITGVVNGSGQGAEAVASQFLGFVAALPFEGPQAQQAQTWVLDHLAGEGRTAIGGGAGLLPTMLSLSGTPAVRTLDVYAPQPLDEGR